MPGAFRVAVVTPEREVLTTEARFVALPAYDGEMGVLPRRAPLLVQLGSGVLRVQEAGGGERRLFVSGGFAQMVEDRLTVLTEEASDLADLERSSGRAALTAARALPAGSEEAWSLKQRALDRARAVGRLGH
ncbi:MAG: ATP synthase F1 subunit epsilon [Thermoanaerobaculia bacterium]|nr:MAG: ATP synthase F1 subunit epsilon [Thermoanaerobaculia bacterium]